MVWYKLLIFPYLVFFAKWVSTVQKGFSVKVLSPLSPVLLSFHPRCLFTVYSSLYKGHEGRETLKRGPPQWVDVCQKTSFGWEKGPAASGGAAFKARFLTLCIPFERPKRVRMVSLKKNKGGKMTKVGGGTETIKKAFLFFFNLSFSSEGVYSALKQNV